MVLRTERHNTVMLMQQDVTNTMTGIGSDNILFMFIFAHLHYTFCHFVFLGGHDDSHYHRQLLRHLDMQGMSRLLHVLLNPPLRMNIITDEIQVDIKLFEHKVDRERLLTRLEQTTDSVHPELGHDGDYEVVKQTTQNISRTHIIILIQRNLLLLLLT